jgi:hypothetical protein
MTSVRYSRSADTWDRWIPSSRRNAMLVESRSTRAVTWGTAGRGAIAGVGLVGGVEGVGGVAGVGAREHARRTKASAATAVRRTPNVIT